jgi:hypothetical protein
MASSRTIGRLVVAGLLAGAVLASAVPGAADPTRLRLQNLSFTAAGAFSLFAEGTITFTGSGVLTATFSDTQAVLTPEPGTMVLLGVGLIALAVLPVLRRAGRRQRGI